MNFIQFFVHSGSTHNESSCFSLSDLFPSPHWHCRVECQKSIEALLHDVPKPERDPIVAVKIGQKMIGWIWGVRLIKTVNTFIICVIRCSPEGMNTKVDVEKVFVLWSAKMKDGTLQIVPIEDIWWGQRLVSGMD